MRKIGELKGKPIIEGNPNEIKNNQIHAKTDNEFIILSERKQSNLEIISRGSYNNSSDNNSNNNFTDYTYFNVNSDNYNVVADLMSMYLWELPTYAAILPILVKRADSQGTYINSINSVPSGTNSNLVAVAIPKYVVGELYTEDGYTMIEYSFGKSLDLLSAITEVAPDIQLEQLTSSLITAKQFWNE